MDATLTTDSTQSAPNPGPVAAPLGLKVRVTMPGVDYIFEGMMEHFIGGEASILLDHNFVKDTAVRVEFHGFQFDGQVLYCERKNGMYDTHVIIPDVDATGIRRDPRYVVNLPARLYGSRGESSLDVKIIDISREGLGLESTRQLDVGETVAVESQFNLAFGIVRHCREVGSRNYRAGVHVYNVIAREEALAEASPAHQEKRPWVRSFFSQRRSNVN